MDHPPELKPLSLCTGYAGIDLGLKRALRKIRAVCYVEIEAFVIFNLVKKTEAKLLDAAPVFTDLKRFPWEQFTGRVDILSGGFPCQPFSAAGQRAGDEDPRHLWPYIVQGIRELGRPPIVFFENVEGIISSKLKNDRWADPEGTPVLLHVLRELERLGYKATAGVFSAREVGAPHQRKRVFIMGVRSDLGPSGRNLVSAMLRDTESGVKLVNSSDNGREGKRAFIQEKRGSLDRRGQSIPSKRDASDADTEYASRAYPAPRGAEQYIWEPPRVTELGNTDSRNKRPQGWAKVYTQKERKRKTDRPQRSSVDEHLGNTQHDERSPATERRGSQGINKGDGKLAYPNSARSQRSLPVQESTTKTKGVFTRSSAPRNVQGKTKSEMGGDFNGASRWMDYAELCESLDNRTDELRMLGNGVIPDTAEKAFRLLWERINF